MPIKAPHSQMPGGGGGKDSKPLKEGARSTKTWFHNPSPNRPSRKSVMKAVKTAARFGGGLARTILSGPQGVAASEGLRRALRKKK